MTTEITQADAERWRKALEAITSLKVEDPQSAYIADAALHPPPPELSEEEQCFADYKKSHEGWKVCEYVEEGIRFALNWAKQRSK